MIEPKASRPHWPDAVQNPSKDLSGLKPWPWALERLEQSHNYWISTTRPDGRPHLMLVWGVWWQDAFWFSTGPRTRKAKNIAARSEEHMSELQSHLNLVCRLLLEKKKKMYTEC